VLDGDRLALASEPEQRVHVVVREPTDPGVVVVLDGERTYLVGHRLQVVQGDPAGPGVTV
jgi:hypothetical protein